MCGIAGVLGGRATSGEDRAALVASMAGALAHRGPDGTGAWTDGTTGVALGHTRLAVVDLSPAGAQPMTSADGRWVLAFNGEIYNHRELRRRLAQLGTGFRGTSDTEVLLEAAAAWGPEKALDETNGMFALALWDRTQRRLLLARDRMGEKPLYYGRAGDAFVFASELKALRRHPGFVPDLDRAALTLYLRHGFVPAPHSVYSGVRKLPPGCLLWVDGSGQAGQPQPYWHVDEAATRGQRDGWHGSPAEAVDELARLAGDAVALRMRADVPVGAFLSGGIDSSLVVALMGAHSPHPVRTFTIGFDEPAYDESAHARAVAGHLGTEHTELVVTPAEAQRIVPSLAEIYDEPFADSSQIPSCLLAALTRRHVTVSLSGDGGDELFAGYDRYLLHDRMVRGIAAVPGWLRAPAARALQSRDPAAWERALAPARPLTARLAAPGRLGERIHRFGGLLAGGPDDLYRRLVSAWQDPARVVLGAEEPPDAFPVPPPALPGRGSARLRHADQRQYLPDDLLVKVDRATMAVSLEARVPLLDHRLVEFAWRLPEPMLVRGGRGKWILRELLARHVPRERFERPKMGFGVPIGDWLRGPLRPWAEDLLDEPRLRDQSLLDAGVVRAVWLAHRDGRADHSARLWAVLMLQSWVDRWMPR